MTVFEKASRRKVRFTSESIAGTLNVEDLWDLPLQALDAIAQKLHGKVSTGETVSFIDAPNTSQSFREDKLRLDVIKRVIEVRLGDKDTAEKAAATKAKRERIKEALVKKKDESLDNMSEEELEAMLVE